MNYSKLRLSFLALLAMTILQLVVCSFILQHVLFSILSAIGVILCLLGLWYVHTQTK